MSRNMIDEYLAQLAAQLPGPTRSRAGVVAEIRDGLNDAVDYHRALGLPHDAAMRAAIAEFGSPAAMAAEFAPVVTAGQIHRFGIRFLVLGPVIGVLWLLSAALDSFVVFARPTTIPFLIAVASIVVVAVPCGLFATAATGRASRWISVQLSSAATALLVTASSAAVVDVGALVFVLTVIRTVPLGLAWVAGALAATASLTRLTLALKGIPQLTRARALAF